MHFEATELTDGERTLQLEVQAFLETELGQASVQPGLGFNSARDPEFSRRLAARGWVGMALPRAYGGHDRSAVDRFVVVEELLRWGAPIGHHWVADRQIGPQIARYGTETQKQRFLPGICGGELSFSIGMSEPDSGSDLASLATRATRVNGGWAISGTKVWTTGAHLHDWIVVLCRTTPREEVADRHAGLSQMLVDLKTPGVQAQPIPFIDGTADFCEVVFDEAFVPDDLVLGEIGAGWAQNASELVYERGGPDRFLSTYLVVQEFLRECGSGGRSDATLETIGSAVAHYWVLHGLSLSVARAIDQGRTPATEAALVKEMGTRFEQDIVNAVLQLIEFEPNLAASGLFERLLTTATLTAPSFTIRGGTNEILRSIVAKGLRPTEHR
ncbi:MAG TPA: acyl-CoA dehydrogenase family protein [Acidimicrobiales bacterium]|jgi:alkylation response protein AidB-like acyl-CoA dehydrogenase